MTSTALPQRPIYSAESVPVASTADPQPIEEHLPAVLQSVFPEWTLISVQDVELKATGLSCQNWTFSAQWSQNGHRSEKRMLLRRDPPASILATDRTTEFHILQALASTDVPAPVACWIDDGANIFGSPAMLMDFVEGSCEWMVLNGPRPIEERLRFASHFIETLALIQNVDLERSGLCAFQERPGHPAKAELDRWETEYRTVEMEPLPEMEAALQWMRARLPTAQRSVLVHGDYKPGNILLGQNKVAAVLDWETAHIGDPLEDLGWITNPARAREHQIAGQWESRDIVAAYEKATGMKVDPGELRWWNIFSCWKLSVIVLTGIRSFINGELNRAYMEPAWFFQHMLEMMKDEPCVQH